MAPVYMAFLRFMGDDNEAKKFSYSLEVGGNGRKLIWQGIPRSIRDSHRKVRDSQDGLIIQRSLALYFSGGDRQELKLRVTGRIWKEEWEMERLNILLNCTVHKNYEMQGFLHVAKGWSFSYSVWVFNSLYMVFYDDELILQSIISSTFHGEDSQL